MVESEAYISENSTNYLLDKNQDNSQFVMSPWLYCWKNFPWLADYKQADQS